MGIPGGPTVAERPARFPSLTPLQNTEDRRWRG